MKYSVWKPGDPVLCAPKLAWDTETEIIVDHTAPKVVLLQVYDGTSVQMVHWEDIPAYLEESSKWNSKTTFIMHNCSFDVAVLGYPEFLIQAATEDRLIDTMFRFSLFVISTKGFLTQRSLKYACKEILNRDIDKDESVRLTFTRGERPTKEHLEYAAWDPVHTYDLSEGLGPQPTEFTQVRGSIALDSISRRGFLVDEERRAGLECELKVDLAHQLQVLEDNGYVPGVKGNTQVLQDYLEMLENLYNVTLPRTPKSGKIQTTEVALGALGDVATNDRFLIAYKEHKHINKLIKTYLKTDVIGSDGRVHTKFNPMVVTGRTSSGSPNIQNLPRKGGIRGIFIPPKGYCLAAVDYSQLELCTLAQTILVTQGKSILADKINAGQDCHRYLASIVFNKSEDAISKADRNFAKIANFGYPGGLSSETFVPYAKGFGLDITEKESADLRNAWFKAYPEMRDYLCPEQQPGDPTKYMAKTITGRVRARCIYTEANNTPFVMKRSINRVNSVKAA